MPSKLRYSSQNVQPAQPSRQTFHPYDPNKRQRKMSLTQSYYLAHTTRGKLSAEAARGDHDLRLLVGHANLLDSLMLELSQAENEQEQWFNQSVKGAAKDSDEPRHIQWADAAEAADNAEDDWEYDDSTDSSDSESESDEEEDFVMHVPLRKVPSPPAPIIESRELGEWEEDEEMTDEEDLDGEEYSDLGLVRTSSRSPPELLHDSDDSDEESMPPSPPQVNLQSFSNKHKEQVATTSFYDPEPFSASSPLSLAATEESYLDEGFYLSQNRQSAMVGAC